MNFCLFTIVYHFVVMIEALFCVPSWKKYCSKVILENVLSPIW